MRLQLTLWSLFALLLCTGAASAQQEPKIKVTPLLETVTTLTGQKLEYPKDNPQVKVTMAELPPRGRRGMARASEPPLRLCARRHAND